jgi:ankyrin repeat protein
MHGTTALLEAVKNANDNVMDILLANDAKLCMSEHLAASVLCQTVSDGDIVLLKRLLRAGINPNAADYDKRTAAHIAAAEGHAAALRTLSESGADLTLRDRWGQTAGDEAKRSQGSINKDMNRTLETSVHLGVTAI